MVDLSVLTERSTHYLACLVIRGKELETRADLVNHYISLHSEQIK